MSFLNPLPPGIRQVVPDYVSDGTTSTFGFPFRLWDDDDLYVGVQLPGASAFTRLVNGSDYSVVIAGVTSATVTLNAPAATGALIRLKGLRTPSRLTSTVNDGVILSGPLESELDCVEATLQEQRRDQNGEVSRAIAAEAQLAAGTAAETTRALIAESAIAGLVYGEAARAATAETSLAASVVAERSRAQVVEYGLASSIGALATPIVAAALGIADVSLLPAILPSTAGTFWNNGGALCVTPGGTNPLTTIPPATGLWNNGGAVCVA